MDSLIAMNEKNKGMNSLSKEKSMDCDSNEKNMKKRSDEEVIGLQSLSSLPSMQLLECLESEDNDCKAYSVMEVIKSCHNSDRSHRSYNPSSSSRQMHNQKERLRRSRMKCSCDALRRLVPGVSDKTDKATVLEHTVNFVVHLSLCPTVNCGDYLPEIPPPVSSKVMQMYSNLSSSDYRYYVPNEEQNLKELEQRLSEYENQQQQQQQQYCGETASHIIELPESIGTQFVTTCDGLQYMIIESTQQTVPNDEQIVYERDIQSVQSMEASVGNSYLMSLDASQEMGNNCFQMNDLNGEQVMASLEKAMNCTNNSIKSIEEEVIDVFVDEKENIDPNLKKDKRKPKLKRVYRKKKFGEQELLSKDNKHCNDVDIDSVVDSVIDSDFDQNIKKRKQKKQNLLNKN